jgi:subtilisin family serine protease
LFNQPNLLKDGQQESKMFQGRMKNLVAAASVFVGIQAQATSDVQAVPGEYVVKMKENLSAVSLQEMGQILGGEVVLKISKASNAVLLKRSPLERENFVIQSLQSNPAVEIVEPNLIYSIDTDKVSENTPNDPMLDDLWGLHNTGSNVAGPLGSEGIDVDALRAWDIQTGSRDVVVAVIDTGVGHDLQDLAPNMWTNEAELNGRDGVDDDGNGFVDDIYGYDFANDDGDPQDDHGHGSHCSGTIGAKGDDGQGIVGVAWDVRIMGIKFLTGSGSGTLANAIRSIDYATQMEVDIMSNSWGGGGFSENLKQSIERAHDAGILFTAAAGNNRADNDRSPNYPASYDIDNIISVAAIDNRGRLASFSAYGRETVDVGAPGVNVVSTTPGGYKSWSGTSMATPHVSGVAALVLSNEPGMSMSDLRDRLINRAEPTTAMRSKVASGGIINAYYALTDSSGPSDPNDPFNWDKNAQTISTDHPYADNSDQEWTVSVPGAEKIAIYFSRFETEAGYDQVRFFSTGGQELGMMEGSNDGSFSPVFNTDTVIIRLTSDSSVNRYGFDVEAVAYQ